MCVWRRGVLLFVPLFFPLCIRRVPWLGVFKASWRLRRGKGGVIYSSQGCAGIIRAAFVLPAGRPPARPGWSAASSAAAGRSRHVVRGEKEPPHPARLHSSTAPHKALGKGGGGKRERKGKRKKKPTPNPPFPCSARDAERQEAAGESPPRHRPALRRTRRRMEGEAMMAAALTQHGARPGAPCPPPAAPPAARDTVLPQPFT